VLHGSRKNLECGGKAVFRATPLFEPGCGARLRAKAVPRPAHSAALVTALQNGRKNSQNFALA